MADGNITQGERLARIEERLDNHDAHIDRLTEMREDFIALKAKWGLVAAIIGSLFAGLVTVVLRILEGWGQ